MSSIIATPPADPAARNIRTILVVEHEVLIRMPLAEYLRGCGYRVFEAVSVPEVKTVLGAGASIDLVFADVKVPGAGSGFTLANWIRRHHPRIKVLLTSGIANAAAKAGQLCEEMMPKPYEHASLLQRIQSLLQARARKANPGRTRSRGFSLASVAHIARAV
jgi:CheY-like chemotaxis protein